MRAACVYTVKNEVELLRRNLAYHRHLGVSDFFVFLDGTSDGTKESIRSFPGLHLFEDLPFDEVKRFAEDKPALEMDFYRQNFTTHSELRQILNANMALELCKESGIGWLLCLDPDELVCLDPIQAKAGGLARLFAGLDAGVGAVWFKNIEAVPVRVESPPFSDRLFKSDRFAPATADYPKAQVFNPFTQEFIPAGWFWGHNSGKIALRPGNGACFHSTHDGHASGERITCQYLLHYNITSYRQFVNKYRNFSAFPNRKNARPLRLLLCDVVNCSEFSEMVLREYYRENILYT